MLTEAERKWLGNREFANAVNYGAYSCPSCWWLNKELEECILRRCLRFDPDYQDAAEFEARVAAKLAEHAGDIALTLQAGGLDQLEADKMLRAARFAVEAEMEKEK